MANMCLSAACWNLLRALLGVKLPWQFNLAREDK